MRLRAPAVPVIVALALVAPRAGGDAPRDVPSVFFVSKSENRNEVHYYARLDDRCAPLGELPLVPYWRMLERDPRATEPLLSREVPAYGIREQRVLSRTDEGGTVRVVLNALPSRPLLVTSSTGTRGCAAVATLPIGGVPAQLARIHVQLRWPFGVDSLTLEGRAEDDGRAVSERVTP